MLCCGVIVVVVLLSTHCRIVISDRFHRVMSKRCEVLLIRIEHRHIFGMVLSAAFLSFYLSPSSSPSSILNPVQPWLLYLVLPHFKNGPSPPATVTPHLCPTTTVFQAPLIDDDDDDNDVKEKQAFIGTCRHCLLARIESLVTSQV